MKPHPRIRKTVKWGGTVVSVLLVVVWVGSGWVWATWQRTSWASWTLAGGRLLGQDTGGLGSGFRPGLHIVRTEYPGLLWRFESYDMGIVQGYAMPIWPVLLASVLLTALAWRLDTLARRRARVGLCPTCNYDRAGLAVGAVCPECGAAP